MSTDSMLIINDTELTLRMQTDLRLGHPIIIKKGEENFLIFSTECISEENFNLLMKSKENIPFLCITSRRAQTLKARVYDGSVARITIPEGTKFSWVKATADPVLDLTHPMKGPHTTIRIGDADLAKLSIEWCKTARLIPSSIIKVISDKEAINLKEKSQVLCANFSQIADKKPAPFIRQESTTVKIPIKGAVAKLRVFKIRNDDYDHCAIEFGNPDRSGPVLTRIHSACFTGDVLNSQKCDCGKQLNTAVEKLIVEQGGILLYLNQEGRGIGLVNKIRAYKLQEQGYDTVDANHRLGFEDEERDFQIGAEILKSLGFSCARLMTNNPNKIRMLENNGIRVLERLSLLTEPTNDNLHYLRTKAKKSGHLF